MTQIQRALAALRICAVPQALPNAAERFQGMDPAIVPGDVGRLELAGRSRAGNAEGAERQLQGVRARESGSLETPAPRFEETGKAVEVGQGVDADHPQPRGGTEGRIGI